MWLALSFVTYLLVEAYLFTQGYETLFFVHKTPEEKQIQQRKIMNQNLNPKLINPAYVQITKKEAAAILGFSVAELDRRRKSDDRCPVGFKERDDRMAPVRFRLSDIYTYSEAIMKDAIQATG